MQSKYMANNSERFKTIPSIDEQSSVMAHSEVETDNFMIWVNKLQASLSKKPNQLTTDKSPTFYMVGIDQISQISYKKLQPTSKVYLKLLFNLYDGQHDEYLNRTVTSQAYQLHSYRSNFYESRDRLSLYFYTYRSVDIYLKVDFVLYEALQLPSGKYVVSSVSSVGTMKLDLSRISRTKQKQPLFLADYPTLGGKTDVMVEYWINISDSYKILEKVIPCECLVSSQDEISGIVGRQLPNNQFIKMEFVELLALKVDFSQINIMTSVVDDAARAAERIYRGMYPRSSNWMANVKQYRICGHFHNGWHVVNSGSVTLKQHMQVQKKHNKQEVIKLTKFISDEVLMIPFVFIGEDCVLLIEVAGKVEVKCSGYPSEVIDVQMGWTYHQMQSSTNPQHKNVKHLMNSTSSIQYYLHMQHTNKTQFSQHNKSIINPNDKVQLEKQRIMRENQKIKQQSRKRKIELNQQLPILDINSIRQDAYVKSIEAIRADQKQKLAILQLLKEKYNQYIIHQQQTSIYNNPPHHQDYQLTNHKKIKNHYDAVYVQSALRKAHKPVGEIYSLLIPPFPTLETTPIEILKTELQQCQYSYLFFISLLTLIPNNQHHLLPNKFYLTITLFTISINTLNLTINQSTGQIHPIDTKHQGTTNKRVSFKSDQVYEKHNVENIIHIEIEPIQYYNSQSHFLRFINYMYHGYMEVVVMDADKNIPFGYSYFQLRQLIRKRRNQVTHLQQSIVHNNIHRKAKLKISIRSMRKQYTKKQQIPSVAQQYTPHTLESRQLLRINRYKANQDKEYSAKLQTLTRIIEQNYIKKDLRFLVSRMQAQVIMVEIENKSDQKCTYQVVINDQHSCYLQQPQMVFLYDVKQYNNAIINLPKNVKCVSLEGLIDLSPNDKVNVPFLYKTSRKHYHPSQKEQQPSPTTYNLPHQITISFTNNNKISSLHRIHIQQAPQYNCIKLQLHRRKLQPTKILIPSIEHILQECKVYLDNPTVTTQLVQKNDLVLECVVGNINKKTQINLCIYHQPTHTIIRNLQIVIWGANELFVEGILWKQVDAILEIPYQQVSQVFLINQDDRVIISRQKNPITVSKPNVYARLAITANCLGILHYEAYILHPITRNILHRYVITVETLPNSIKQYCILKIKNSDKLLEQPFTYQNPFSRKNSFQILSTKPQIMWPTNDTIQIQAKGEKKVMIKINAQLINNNDSVVIGFKSENILDYVMFTFQKK